MSGAFTLPKSTLDTYTPVYDSILVRMVNQGERVSETSTVIRPQTAMMDNFFGRVVRVGPGRPLYSEAEIDEHGVRVHYAQMPVAPGDDVLFRRYHGERMDFGGHLYLALKEADVIGKLDLSEALEKGFITWASPDDSNLTDALDASRTFA